LILLGAAFCQVWLQHLNKFWSHGAQLSGSAP
jgi:hypothetical protein